MAKLVSAPRVNKLQPDDVVKTGPSSASNVLGLVLIMAFVAIAIYITIGAFHIPPAVAPVTQ